MVMPLAAPVSREVNWMELVILENVALTPMAVLLLMAVRTLSMAVSRVKVSFSPFISKV